MSIGAKKDEPTTGCIWASEFHRVMARSCLACVLKLGNHYFFNFQIFFLRGGELQITESADVGARLCFQHGGIIHSRELECTVVEWL
jgi:hypothetical protein